MLDFTDIAGNISCNENGIYTTDENNTISYPNKGNAYSFALEDDSFWFKHRSRVIVHLVKQYCPHAVFFDVGGGNGFVTKSLQNNGINAILIEPGAEGIANAQLRGVQNIIQSTFEAIDFKPNRVKAVGLFDVLEHIEYDVDFLHRLQLAMSKGGYLFITVPAYQFLWSNDDIQAGHFKRYRLTKLEKLLKATGFKIVRSSYIFSFLVLPVFLLRTVPDFFKQATATINFAKHQTAHQPKPLLNYLLCRFCGFELRLLKQGQQVWLGSSCVVVAQVG